MDRNKTKFMIATALDLDKTINSLSQGEILLVQTDSDNCSPIELEALKAVTAEDSSIAIFSKRPYSNMMTILAKQNIGQEKLFVIDTLTKANNAKIKSTENISYIDSPSDLENILRSLEEVMKCSKIKNVFIDSISSLLVHNDSTNLLKFMHKITTKVRAHNAKCIFVTAVSETNKEVIETLSRMCDKTFKAN